MTYIISARCREGVVLVGDQKILRGNVASHKEKLTQVLPVVIMGGAGASGLTERFSDEIQAQVQAGNITNSDQLLQFVEERSMQLSQTYASRVGHFDILIGMRAGPTAQLFNIITQSGFAEPIKEYTAIGSGVPYGSFLLKKLWRKDMATMDFAKVAHMVISYVIDLKLDDFVGGKPQVWFIPNVSERVDSQEEIEQRYPIRKANSTELTEMQKYTEEKLSRIKSFLDELSNDV